ncbi:hypothetical protein SAICODRAFT_71137 [Saitoella complicata NRRL Y-17804]|nr:uncharacterized protein SAICODRAFT_71137 [Saitoella complicata NRRL Y-17804]ODQ53133.1 hypothetical protein SAICODRAFT_71137 [Saitoella complicata NRRL Y-17804]
MSSRYNWSAENERRLLLLCLKHSKSTDISAVAEELGDGLTRNAVYLKLSKMKKATGMSEEKNTINGSPNHTTRKRSKVVSPEENDEEGEKKPVPKKTSRKVKHEADKEEEE